jgi:acyl-Coa thioesterase superfamily protein/acyl-CoA thioesterase superfamily protein
VHSAFYEPAGPGTFFATPATAGPWSAQAQHGGPPSALVAREFERYQSDEGQRLARVTVDILRPVPLGMLEVRTRMVRPGRRVALLEAVLEAGGREVLHARGWRIALSGGAVPARPSTAAPPPIPAEQLLPTFAREDPEGYMRAIDWRFLDGGFQVHGPGRAWTRPLIPLLAGEQASPMCRALLVADSGSGVSMTLDPAEFLSINVDLTVILSRDPVGEWLLLDSATTIGEQGTGLAETTLSDTGGPCGRGLQTLLVERR